MTHKDRIGSLRAFGELANGVRRVRSCSLSVGDGAWPFAGQHAAEIDEHWSRRIVEAPAMFNGVIHVMHAATEIESEFRGAFWRTDFQSYLYWRELGFPEAGVLDCFGSALIRSVEGHVLLGRQRAGNINAGKAYLPGGFIDPRDVSTDGAIDIEGSILRELAEETGLQTGDVKVSPGFHLTRRGALLSVALEVRSALRATALRDRVLAHIAGDPKSELVDAVIVRSAGEIDGIGVHEYARQLLEWLFAQEAGVD